MRKLIAYSVAAVFLCAGTPRAEPISIDKIPEALKPWAQWVLDGREEARCPGFPGAAEAGAPRRECFWPARLELSLDDREGRFRQDWQAYKDGWVPLPGDAKRWPQDVQVDGRPAATVLRGGAPHVRLSPGGHAVAGGFHWDSTPELLQIPAETGLVGLTIRGKRIEFPNRDEQGRLWLQKAAGRQQGENRLEVVVHRRVVDDIPLLLATDLELKVSGKTREVLLGKALPEGFIPTALEGPLPARVERDGRLRVQVRPGNWRISLAARHEGPVSELRMPVNSGPGAGPWSREEAWVFDARPDLRLVSVEGVPAVDPQQTELPQDWRRLPAYLLREGDAMRLAERRRGDADPAPDQLGLQRSWWLDFDGGGYSIRDRIDGTLRRSWRMEMAAPTALGRVAVGGVDQFITALKPEPGKPKMVGIEIRQGSVSVDADSRLEGARFGVPAVGWNHDFHQVSGTLNLPPGWTLVHAFGVDEAPQTWFARWTLLDLFTVFIIALAAGKLWGPGWGALALATLTLCWHEPGSPRWVWAYLLAADASARNIPEGKLRKAAETGRAVLRVGLLLIAVPFLVYQLRAGLHPQLGVREEWQTPGLSSMLLPTFSLGELAADKDLGAANANTAGVPAAAPAPYQNAPEEPESAPALEGAEADNSRAYQQAGERGRRKQYVSKAKGSVSMRPLEMASFRKLYENKPMRQQNMNVYVPDVNAKVPTGPGLPTWSWKSVPLIWRGPVDHAQRMHLILIGPFGNFILSVARAALIVLLTLGALGLAAGDWLRDAALRARGPGWTVLFLSLALPWSPRSARAEMPSPDLLNELQARLLRPAECEPQCASIPRMRLEAEAGALRARLEVAAAAPAGVPLPGGAQQWTPAAVSLDGVPAKGLLRSGGTLYLPVGPGMHQVVLEGPLPEKETVEIPLPLKPHRVEVRASGWTVDGLREDGVPDENLQMTRARGAGGGPADLFQGGTLPPFVTVAREIRLGLSWHVDTRVVRQTPLGTAVVLEVPLLPGEAVTSPEIRVEKGKAKISMGPQVSEIAWGSALAETGSLKLRAPDSVPWTEVWRLDANPIWHAVPEGIPVIHAEDSGGARVREWRPWPGEAVTLAVSRPEGVAGQTTTIDRSALTVNPGLRATDVALEFNVRSSRGGQQTLTLPEGAELQSLTMDGGAQPVRQEKRSVAISILPGSHQAALAWRQGGGIGMFFRAPEVKLGLASVNASAAVTAPSDRWILWTWGPRLGPAVLFWELLAVVALAGFGLGKWGKTPLDARDWFLLGLGLTQLPMAPAALVAGWLLALGARRRIVLESPWRFDLVQWALAAWTAVALGCLYEAIHRGLLGQPEMQIAGNGSWGNHLQWYQDRALETLPRPWVVSVPRLAYRLAMMAWAMWITSSLLAWLRWGWSCFSEGGFWKPVAWPRRKKVEGR